ncbi:osmosensitive cation channel TMEM63C-like isoform X2 [Mixophyes fleayi]|uniref:osmosensitive cation channel TMEM63C-like isoform X2 n=1 Tax=Mixophyes fleayi TaxID=3061075 RepID=UPI003F4E3EBA
MSGGGALLGVSLGAADGLWRLGCCGPTAWCGGSGGQRSQGNHPADQCDITSLDAFLQSTASMEPPLPEDPTGNVTDQCYRAHSRSSVLQGLPFGGVPTVLAINFLAWLFLLLVFSCLRKAAWDYGRLALLIDNDSLTSLFYGEPTDKEKSPCEISPSDLTSKDLGFCSWLSSIYQMKDEDIQSKCGADAITYLSYQRHLLVLLLLVCVLSVSIILPVNFSGDLLGDSPAQFGRTTIVNVPIQDRFLWLHSVFALVYFLLTALCMKHHSTSLHYREDDQVNKYTNICTSYSSSLSLANQSFFISLISSRSSKLSCLFATINSLPPSSYPALPLCHPNFVSFFSSKIEAIRLNISSSHHSPATLIDLPSSINRLVLLPPYLG